MTPNQPQRLATLRSALAWFFGFVTGAVIVFGIVALALQVFPYGNDLTVWALGFGFLFVVALVVGGISARITKAEKIVDERTAGLREANQALAEQMVRRERAEQSMREEALFPALNPGPAVRFDATGQIIQANPSAKSLIGEENLTGTIQSLLSIDDDVIRAAIKRGVTNTLQTKFGDRWFQCILRGVPDLGMGVMFGLDVHDRQLAEEEVKAAEIRTRAILDGAADSIFIVLRTGILEAANPATERLFGYDVTELVGHNVHKLLPELFEEFADEDPLDVLARYAVKKRTGPLEKKIYAYRKGGDRVPVAITVSRFNVQGVDKVSCIVRDITDRVLADEIQMKQAEKLASQNTELQSLNSDLAEFNYVASHDLQEPLRTMSAYCGLLEKDLGGNLPDRAKEDLTAITDASIRMQRLVTDLLEFSRLGNRELKLESVDLTRTAKQVAFDLKARLEESNGTLTWDEPLPTVQGDIGALGRVFLNLVSNGLKFRGDNDPVVHISAKADDDHWILSIRDNGIGIPSEYIDKIFQPFKRLHGIGKYEGSGIGLAVCRKIVERHNGRIWVESTEGNGSQFFVALPRAKELDDDRNNQPSQ